MYLVTHDINGTHGINDEMHEKLRKRTKIELVNEWYKDEMILICNMTQTEFKKYYRCKILTKNAKVN